jgi:hypothetical protein
MRRVRDQGLPIPGLTVDEVRDLLIDFVVNQHGRVEQMAEKRPHFSDRGYWYRVVIPMPKLPKGLFVEIIMHDPDPDCPAVLIVSAHR